MKCGRTLLPALLAGLFALSCSKSETPGPDPVPAVPIGTFESVVPGPQTTEFILPETHLFQKIIETGDPLTDGGDFPVNPDFSGYVPIGGSSEEGYLSINSEWDPGGVTVLTLSLNQAVQLWEVSQSRAVDFAAVAGTARNCSGTVTPWNTIISCEEGISPDDVNGDSRRDLGWAVEIDPATATVLDKRWAMGNFQHENATVHSNRRTVYQGADSNPGYLYKFVADQPGDLSSGSLYAYQGEKDGTGNWIPLLNDTPEEQNSTLEQCEQLGATVFNGIEDVEIGPDGQVYFAVKGEGKVYRFQDSGALSGSGLTMETFVGAMDYAVSDAPGAAAIEWGLGNDNLAFDDQGNLWVLQDGGNNYIWVVGPAHSQTQPQERLFGIPPIGSEPTGITFTPDFNYLFLSVQHPDAGNDASTQTDAAGTPIGFGKSITLAIARKGFLGLE